MFPPGRFSECERFWGIQVNHSGREKQVRVNADTKLHISKVLVDVGNFPHQDNCSVTIGVWYETVRCDCKITGQSCSLHPQQKQSCVLCIIKPGQKNEADLDINFVGRKNLTFYYSFYCDCGFKSTANITVNISGYEEVRG